METLRADQNSSKPEVHMKEWVLGMLQELEKQLYGVHDALRQNKDVVKLTTHISKAHGVMAALQRKLDHSTNEPHQQDSCLKDLDHYDFSLWAWLSNILKTYSSADVLLRTTKLPRFCAFLPSLEFVFVPGEQYQILFPVQGYAVINEILFEAGYENLTSNPRLLDALHECLEKRYDIKAFRSSDHPDVFCFSGYAHSTCALIAYLQRNLTPRKRLSYIGTSEPPCIGCHQFILAHNTSWKLGYAYMPFTA